MSIKVTCDGCGVNRGRPLSFGLFGENATWAVIVDSPCPSTWYEPVRHRRVDLCDICCAAVLGAFDNFINDLRTRND